MSTRNCTSKTLEDTHQPTEDVENAPADDALKDARTRSIIERRSWTVEQCQKVNLVTIMLAHMFYDLWTRNFVVNVLTVKDPVMSWGCRLAVGVPHLQIAEEMASAARKNHKKAFPYQNNASGRRGPLTVCRCTMSQRNRRKELVRTPRSITAVELARKSVLNVSQ